MPVIREKRSYFTQPVGVVRAGADSFGVTSGIGELADSLIKGSYDTLVNEAKKKGQDLARTVKQSTFKSLNPETGQVEVLKPPSTFGTAAANAYQESIEARYIAGIESDIKEYALQNYALYENDRDGYAKFEQGLTGQVQALVDETDPRFKELVTAVGSSMLGSYKANFLQKDIERKQRDTINSNISIIDKNNTQITDNITVNVFDADSLASDEGANIIAESFEQIQGIIDGNMHIGNNSYMISDNPEVLNVVREKTIAAVSSGLENVLAKIARESGSEEDLLIAKMVIMANGDGVEDLPLPYQVFIKNLQKLQISGNDTFVDEETGELIYEEGKSKQQLLPLVSDNLRQTVNQALPSIRDAEAREQARLEEEQEKIDEQEILQFEGVTSDFLSESFDSVATIAKSGDLTGAFQKANNLYNDYSNKVNDLEVGQDTKKRIKSLFKSNLIDNLLNGIALSGEPSTLTTSEGKQITNRTIHFSPSEVNSINQWLTTGGTNYDLLPENLRDPIKQYVEFAGEDRSVAMSRLQGRVTDSSNMYIDSVQSVQDAQITLDIQQGTADPNDKDTAKNFDNVFTTPLANPDDTYTDSNGNKIIKSGNIYLNPNYVEQTGQNVMDMARTGLMGKQLKDAFIYSTQNELPAPIQANIFNSMRQLETTIDGTGKSKNILVRNLTDAEYNLYKAVEAGVNIRGTGSLSQVLGDVRELSADPDALLTKKKNRYGALINETLSSILKKPLNFSKSNNDDMNTSIMQAAFFEHGIVDARVQMDMLNRFSPYIDLHVSAGGDGQTLFDAVGVYYEKYYQPTHGLVVDPYNPASEVSTYSFSNKRIGQDRESRTLFVTNFNKHLEDKGINAHIGSVSDHFVDGNKHNLAFSIGGMPTLPPTEDVNKSLKGKERIYLMPIAGDPFGYSQYIDPSSEVKGMTENTVYIGVVKNELDEFSPYIFESAEGLTPEDKKAGLTAPRMIIYQYSDLEQIGFSEQDKLTKALEKKQIDFANYLRQAVNASQDDWLTPTTAEFLLDMYKPSID